jgi:hypothetical protein
MSVKRISVYKCDYQYCSTVARTPSDWGEYGYRSEYLALEKRGWYFTGIEKGFKHLCKKHNPERVCREGDGE